MNYNYVFVLLKNIGFYMEPDIEIVRIFSNIVKCREYMKNNSLDHGYYFICKKKVF